MHNEETGLIVKSLTVGMFATNCYLIGCTKTGEGIVIDPGAQGKKIIETIASLGLKVKYILNTHGHIDHIGANGKLKDELAASIYLHERDLPLYENPGYGLKIILKKQPRPDFFINDGDRITVGTINLTVLETPGHTPGSVSFLTDKKLFCGDTLFAGSVGRTDLIGGSHAELMCSIKRKLLTLSPDTEVFPGHGPTTIISDEIRNNPYIGVSG
ncbi:MAG: MBL fold metallo-hydrolase [Bacillota bacterium]|nr:MBL fold metallo-hydrolase [Bacillota bacterium]